VTNATGYLVTLQDGKGIVYQGVVTGVAFDSSTVSGLKLVSGIKYDVSVSSVIVNGSDAVKAAAAKGSATTVKFSEPNLKFQQSEKAKLTTVKLAIDDKITDPTTSARKYVIEYTYIADAKGKADWSTAKVQAATSTSLDLAGLKAGTQYYARVVAYDSTGNATTANSTKISIGKEFKFKTLAAPLATITKPAFALDGNNLALKFTGKVPVDKANAKVLQDNTVFFYELIVSTDAVIDKATGKLANGKSLTTVPNTPDALTSIDDVFPPITQALTGNDGVFAILEAGKIKDVATFKALNFQLLVHYSTGGLEKVYATAYTKVAKLALPKWFV
jgi:hypothetical protein